MNYNRVIHGDCLEAMRGFESESADLVYLDPPFNSNRVHEASAGSKSPGVSFNDTWVMNDARRNEQSELAGRNPTVGKIIDTAEAAYGESMQAYLIFIAARLVEMHRILKQTGSIYLHCDPTASHYLKLAMDGIFGKRSFRNEIVWSYSKWTNGARFFQRCHDIIIYYSKSDDYTFNKPHGGFTEWQKASIKTGYNLGSHNGRKIVRIYDREKCARLIQKWENEGRNIQYVDNINGRAISDVWDISALNGTANERTGYPTQKPIELLNRIVKASSNVDDLVVDPFCGSGTTLEAAKSLGRNYVGIDVSENALAIAEKRLAGTVGSEEWLI